MENIEYLGPYFENGCLKADEKNVTAVAEQPEPNSVKKLQSFFGLANYYNRFIQHFAEIVLQLTTLLQKNVAWNWGTSQQEAFDKLKAGLRNPSVLQLPSLYHYFVIETNASKFSISATLMQDIGRGLKLVQYFSKKLSSAEQRYPTHDRELLAIVSAFRRFRPYVGGGITTVIIDHKPFKCIPTQPNLNDRQVHQIQQLAPYNYIVYYNPGRDNTAADALSHRPDLNVAYNKHVHFVYQRGLPLCTVNVLKNEVLVPMDEEKQGERFAFNPDTEIEVDIIHKYVLTRVLQTIAHQFSIDQCIEVAVQALRQKIPLHTVQCTFCS